MLVGATVRSETRLHQHTGAGYERVKIQAVPVMGSGRYEWERLKTEAVGVFLRSSWYWSTGQSLSCTGEG